MKKFYDEIDFLLLFSSEPIVMKTDDHNDYEELYTRRYITPPDAAGFQFELWFDCAESNANLDLIYDGVTITQIVLNKNDVSGFVKDENKLRVYIDDRLAYTIDFTEGKHFAINNAGIAYGDSKQGW